MSALRPARVRPAKTSSDSGGADTPASRSGTPLCYGPADVRSSAPRCRASPPNSLSTTSRWPDGLPRRQRSLPGGEQRSARSISSVGEQCQRQQSALLPVHGEGLILPPCSHILTDDVGARQRPFPVFRGMPSGLLNPSSAAARRRRTAQRHPGRHGKFSAWTNMRFRRSYYAVRVRGRWHHVEIAYPPTASHYIYQTSAGSVRCRTVTRNRRPDRQLRQHGPGRPCASTEPGLPGSALHRASRQRLI